MLAGDNGNFGSDLNPCPTSLPRKDYRKCVRDQENPSRLYQGPRTYARDGEVSDRPMP
jgi:hypothetical protein